MTRLLPIAVACAGAAALAAGGPAAPGVPEARAREAKEVVFQALCDGDLFGLPGSPLLKQVPASARVAVVRAAGEAVKAWTRTAEFKARYAAWRVEQLPLMPPPPRTRAQLVKQAKAEIATQRAEMEQALAGTTPDQKELVAQTRAQAEAVFKQQLRDADSPDAEENDRQRYHAELSAWEEASATVPQDPKVRLRALLQAFLEQTAGVDFKAALKPDRSFVRSDFEEQSRAWKAAYRAGPEATAAARDFATTWLKELQ